MSEQSDVDKINEAVQEPVPNMADAPETHVKLMRGLYTPATEQWHDVAEVRELNGEDEEYLASVEKKKGLLYAEYMTALLARAVLRIGSVDLREAGNPEEHINNLILGDRDILYLAVVKATYGDERTINVACTDCGKLNDVVLELDKDFPIAYPDFNVREGLKIQTSKGTITMRLPNGKDTVEGNKLAKNDAELNTVLLSRCAKWPEGEAPENPMRWARSLSIKDRRTLVDALLAVEIGPKLEEVNTQCASCGKDMPILLDWVSLLLS